MKPPLTKRSVRILLLTLMGLAAGFLLTACPDTEGSCGRSCAQDCGGYCEKASGHSGQHECNFCHWHWY